VTSREGVTRGHRRLLHGPGYNHGLPTDRTGGDAASAPARLTRPPPGSGHLVTFRNVSCYL